MIESEHRSHKRAAPRHLPQQWKPISRGTTRCSGETHSVETYGTSDPVADISRRRRT
jgi:hypothetical protein